MTAEPLQAVEADATKDPEGTLVPLITDSGEAKVTVPNPGKWKTRANSALRQGDFDVWASLVLSEDDYEAWRDVDPTNDDVETFFEAWNELTGEDQAKSRASRRSSKNTRKR